MTNATQGLGELGAALAKAQGELRNVGKDKTAKAGSYSYSYADIADGLDVLRPVLSKHGLCLIQTTSLDGGIIMLHTRLLHASGQWIEGTFPVCAPGKAQEVGSALTYARRYAAFSIAGVAGTEEDQDGANAAPSAAPEHISTKQALELADLATEVGADVKRFASYLGVKSLKDLPADQYQRAKDALEAKREAANGDA